MNSHMGRWLVLAGLVVLTTGGVRAQESTGADRVAELEQKIAEAQKRLDAAKAELETLQVELTQARRQASEALIDRAAKGDVRAITDVLDLLDDNLSFIEYRFVRIVKGPGAPVAVQLIGARLSLPDDSTKAARLRAKLCWLLGENGSALAAARLREVITLEKDADVVATALAALERCPRSPLDVEAVRRHVDDERKIPMVVGAYPHADTLGGYASQLVARWTAKDSATVPGEVVVEEPTFRCLGFEWHIEGDANRNCTVRIAYRKKDSPEWKAGFPLFRCESVANAVYGVSPGNLLAGSVFDLEPGTEYEVKLTLSDPDGGGAERIVTARTRVEPARYAGERTLHVVPGDGGGTGTKDDPLRGIVAADAAARPGDVLLLGPGTYACPALNLTKSGEEGRPVVWRGADRERVIIDGQGKSEILSAGVRRHLHFEDLTFRNGRSCLRLAASDDIVVRRCIFRDFGYLAIYAQGTKGKNPVRCTFTDNVILGPASWKVGRKGSSWGISINGQGHVIARNRIENCWDCVSLAGSPAAGCKPVTASVDITANDFRQATDDGVEADYTWHNIRIYRNRLVNSFSSLSFQPIFGGPGYLLFNEMINTTNKPYKLHVHPSGMIIAHNTSLASREAFYGGNWHHAVFRNNIILGAAGEQGYWMSMQGSGFDMDYTGYNHASETVFVKFNNVRYNDMASLAGDLGVNRHAVVLSLDAFVKAPPVPGPGVQADDAKYDLMLKPGSPAVDAGEVLPGINDGFTGKAPDLGCYESGKPKPRYGPSLD